MKKITTTYHVGDTAIKATSEIDEGQRMDTEIEVGNTFLCVVAGNEFLRFMKELEELVEKYRI